MKVVAVIVPVDGFTVTVEIEDTAAPETVAEAVVNSILCAKFDDPAATTLTFCPVVAKPVTLPVTLPENAPENVVAATVPFDGFIVTVETVEVAAPETVEAAGVNITGWAKLVLAATMFTFCPVVAKPVTLPVTFPVRFPEKAPENVVAETVPLEGLTVTVEIVDTAAPEAVAEAVVNITLCVKFDAPAATTLTF